MKVPKRIYSPAKGPSELGYSLAKRPRNAGIACAELLESMAAKKLLPRMLAAGMRRRSLLGPLRAEKSKTATPLQRVCRNAGE